MNDFNGKLEGFAPFIATPGGPAPVQKRRILLDAGAGDVVVGGNGSGGDIRINDHDNATKIRLDALGSESTPLQNAMLPVPVSISGNGSIKAGSAGTQGKLSLCDAQGVELATLSAATQDLWLRAPDGSATVALRASENQVAGLWLGTNGHRGLLLLRDGANKNRALLSAERGELQLADGKGSNRAVISGEAGRLQLSESGGSTTVDLYASNSEQRAGIMLGTNGTHGFIRCRDSDGKSRFEVDAKDAEMNVQNARGDSTITLRGNDGSGRFGGRGVNGDVLVFSENVDDRTSDNASIWLQGSSGDIILRNADCAEEFDVRDHIGAEPGAVLVLESDGRLAVSTKPYDTRVAGIVSGADGIRPGIVLGRTPGRTGRLPVGLAGKVMCNVDASFGPIEVGTLLTTSPRAGYAMAVSDRERAFGAVIGKAMVAMSAGSGRIPVLVALQ